MRSGPERMSNCMDFGLEELDFRLPLPFPTMREMMISASWTFARRLAMGSLGIFLLSTTSDLRLDAS
jgi:hypothetical protein